METDSNSITKRKEKEKMNEESDKFRKEQENKRNKERNDTTI